MSSDSSPHSPSVTTGSLPEETSSGPMLVGGDEKDPATGQSLPADQRAAEVNTHAVPQETCTEMLNVLNQMKTLQKEMMEMKLKEVNPGPNLPELAQSIWTASRNAQERDKGFGLPPDDDAAQKFFDGFCPSSNDNILKAQKGLQEWMAGPTPDRGQPFASPWNDGYLTNIDLKIRIRDEGHHLWPDLWSRGDNIQAWGICTGPSVDDPFGTDAVRYNDIGQLRRQSKVLLSSPKGYA